ncbi:hypothetical protein E2605_09945 [Dysgonomonas capnocytophagoides]|uniref:Uncharacterized protein n=1 Tax=Dysgonomonas capnocytophagoides TaxID=45254 RepID=A0A4Y8L7K2_9BACT|nr:hypothetical protein E2605_09945 [Dysgonomonas capnocytophagoides]
MSKKILVVMAAVLTYFSVNAQQVQQEYKLTMKTPGNPSVTYDLKESNGQLTAGQSLPLAISRNVTENGASQRIEITIKANELAYYSLEEIYKLGSFGHDDCLFYMPGFWYRRNLRSPKEAPSWYVSDSWQVREDRLSTPLTGIYNEKTHEYYTVLRIDKFDNESQPCYTSGEVILSGKTSLGYTGFRNVSGKSALVFGFPYSEAPKTYIRKLTLDPSVQAFEKLDKGETRKLVWEITKGTAPDYSAFVANVWNYSYDTYKPAAFQNAMSAAEAKNVLSNFFKESYMDKYDLKYYSGVHMRTDDCESTGSVEVGFVGRVLLNAFNALEYGETMNRPDLVQNAKNVFDSYLKYGFTPNGFFREFVDYSHNDETKVYSIRRQSEGAFAILNYLEYERRKGISHKEWDSKMVHLLDNLLKLQEENGSFPRKFDDNFAIIDETGGSTPSATLPLTMAYKYFKNKKYLESARRTAVYLEKELISKADYFSSTLDANCEDKEASLYASTAMYYLAMVSKGKEKEHYIDLSQKAAYFSLSWYYMWDVPFAQGQMLGDVGFKSRGWGNVSVENNHIDVFIFEFATVLDWLSKERKEPRFAQFSAVIKSSMLQLMPVKGHMFNIGKVGYYPEVVQHTNWDYGKNGKGFYNDIFAPGWTVASLWQMLSPDRVEKYFK